MLFFVLLKQKQQLGQFYSIHPSIHPLAPLILHCVVCCWEATANRKKLHKKTLHIVLNHFEPRDCVLPEKSRAHTPSWWKPLNTDIGFNVSVSHMWMEESLPTWNKMRAPFNKSDTPQSLSFFPQILRSLEGKNINESRKALKCA